MDDDTLYGTPIVPLTNSWDLIQHLIVEQQNTLQKFLKLTHTFVVAMGPSSNKPMCTMLSGCLDLFANNLQDQAQLTEKLFAQIASPTLVQRPPPARHPPRLVPSLDLNNPALSQLDPPHPQS